ncbi:MAG TPA: carbohydrate kinase family protein [Candidatus Limiplasma sp.]|nr:carbohydrate kinase family protein [Candidatus Limiplasma sp.]
MLRNGIIVGGVATIDRIMVVDHYPAEGTLVDIGEAAISTGGALCNVLLDLYKLDPSIPLRAVGVIGLDELGDKTFAALQRAKSADLSGIARAGKACYTDVYESQETHQRTFFHQRGANRLLDVEHFDLEHSNAKILSVGYVMLLDTLDSPDGQYGTRMARLLAEARGLGMETCVDVVSLKSARFRETALPALRYATYCVINEIEAQEITGVVLRDGEGMLREENMAAALQAILRAGVGKWAVIHTPEASFGMLPSGEMYRERGAKLAHGYIKGTVGAGDAFCAGVLCIAHAGGTLPQALRAGNATACASLRLTDATTGVLPLPEALRLYDQLCHLCEPEDV